MLSSSVYSAGTVFVAVIISSLTNTSKGGIMDKTKKAEDKSFTRKAGDKIERVGEKLKKMGATKAGNAVYKAGNKLEHSKDNKK